MKRSKFLIPTLLAAGFGPHDTAAADGLAAKTQGGGEPARPSLLEMFKQGHTVTLADHRSHSSHSSHSSHRLEAADTTVTPVIRVIARAPRGIREATSHRIILRPLSQLSKLAPLHNHLSRFAEHFSGEASPPAVDSNLPTLSGRTQRFKAVVQRVQIALLAQGFYNGTIDGSVGPTTRAAVRQLQQDRQLSVTGTITSEVLDALRVLSV